MVQRSKDPNPNPIFLVLSEKILWGQNSGCYKPPPLKMNLVPEIRVAHGIGMVILLSKNPLISRGLPLWWVYPLFPYLTL